MLNCLSLFLLVGMTYKMNRVCVYNFDSEIIGLEQKWFITSSVMVVILCRDSNLLLKVHI